MYQILKNILTMQKKKKYALFYDLSCKTVTYIDSFDITLTLNMYSK